MQSKNLRAANFGILKASEVYLPAPDVLTATPLLGLKREEVIGSVLITFYNVTIVHKLIINMFFHFLSYRFLKLHFHYNFLFILHIHLIEGMARIFLVLAGCK